MWTGQGEVGALPALARWGWGGAPPAAGGAPQCPLVVHTGTTDSLFCALQALALPSLHPAQETFGNSINDDN